MGRARRRAGVRALEARFLPRCPPERADELLALAAALRRAHPGAGDAALAGRLLARARPLLAARGVRYAAGLTGAPGPRLRLERCLEAASVGPAPPQIAEAGHLEVGRAAVDRRTVLGWWRRLLDARRRGRAPRLLQLYCHVPFCRSRCRFCQFPAAVAREPAEVARYLDALEREADAFHRALGPLQVDAATIGGGTPSVLTPAQLDRLLRALVGRVFEVRPGGYFSVEVNPDSATEARLRLLARAGVQRVSLGVQSFAPATLRAVGRGYQTAAQLEAAVASAHGLGLRVALDLLAPLPGETARTFAAGAAHAFALRPDQVMVYRYQPVVRDGAVFAPGDLPFEQVGRLFRDAARAHGYHEVAPGGPSLWAVRRGAAPSREHYRQHRAEPCSTLGLGPFAESHAFGVASYVTVAGPAGAWRYLGRALDGDAEQRIAVCRHLTSGAPLDERRFRATFGHGLARAFPGEVAYLEEAGLLARRGGRVTGRFPSPAEAQRHAFVFFGGDLLQHLEAGREARVVDAATFAACLGAPARRPRGGVVADVREWRWSPPGRPAVVEVEGRLVPAEGPGDEREAHLADLLRGLAGPALRPAVARLFGRLEAAGALGPLTLRASRRARTAVIEAEWRDVPGAALRALSWQTGAPPPLAGAHAAVDQAAGVRLVLRRGAAPILGLRWRLRPGAAGLGRLLARAPASVGPLARRLRRADYVVDGEGAAALELHLDDDRLLRVPVTSGQARWAEACAGVARPLELRPARPR